MTRPEVELGPVDTDRPHFDVVHSLFKQTAARVGWNLAGDRIALEFLLGDDEQAEKSRQMIRADLEAKLDRLSPVASGLDNLLRLLADSCRHPANLYTEVHWCPVDPSLLPD